MSGPYDEDSWDFEDEYDDRDDDPCDHPLECVDYDILTWRAHCSRCGEAWNASNAEMQMEMQFQTKHQKSQFLLEQQLLQLYPQLHHGIAQAISTTQQSIHCQRVRLF